MNQIKIQSILSGGLANHERVVLKSLSSGNIGLYLAFATIESLPGRINSNPKDIFWFPDQEVQAGDLIILYTGPGKPSVTINSNRTKTFFYHWGLKKTIFNKSNDSIALLKLDQWEYKRRG